MSDHVTSLYAALARFQKDLPHIAKNETADAGAYKYDYAGIDVVSETVLPKLAEHGLAFTAWPTIDDGGRFVLRYHLTHEAGEHLDGQYPLPEKGTPQDLGKAISYARRYCLLAASGAAPGGDDNDAQGLPPMVTERPRRRHPTKTELAKTLASQDDDWGPAIEAIASAEDAEAVDQELRQAFNDGKLTAERAGELKRATAIAGAKYKPPRVRTAHQDPEHQRLVESAEDRMAPKAERLRTVPDTDEWVGPMPEEASDA